MPSCLGQGQVDSNFVEAKAMFIKRVSNTEIEEKSKSI